MKKIGSTRSLNGSKAIEATAKPLCPETTNSCVQTKDLDAIETSQNLVKQYEDLLRMMGRISPKT